MKRTKIDLMKKGINVTKRGKKIIDEKDIERQKERDREKVWEMERKNYIQFRIKNKMRKREIVRYSNLKERKGGKNIQL